MSECVAPAGTKVPFKHGKCQRSSAVAQGHPGPHCKTGQRMCGRGENVAPPSDEGIRCDGHSLGCCASLGDLGTNHPRCETT